MRVLVKMMHPYPNSCGIQRLSRMGLTLVELMIGIAVIGVILAVAAPSMADILEKRRVIAAANELAGILAYAKSETSNTQVDLLLRFDEDPAGKLSCVQVAIRSGTGSSDCKCWESIDKKCMVNNLFAGYMLRTFVVHHSTGVSFLPLAAVPGDEPIREFGLEHARVGVNIAGNLRVKVEGRRGTKLRVDLNSSGRVRVCAPDNNVAGYGGCA